MSLDPAAAPWDQPMPPGSRTRSRHDPHRSRDIAPAALDLRLAGPALCAWGAAGWAVGLSGAHAWRLVQAAALLLLLVSVPFARAASRFRAPRHRLDERPGAPGPGGSSAGSLAATLLVCVLAAAAVLTVAAAGSWTRARDPLTAAANRGTTVALTGTVTSTPRVVVSNRWTLVLTEIRVETVDGAPSGLCATVLGSQDWLAASMGSTVAVRTRPQATDPGSRTAALIGSSATVTVTAPPHGLLGAVHGLHEGLAEAAGAPGADSSGTAVTRSGPPSGSAGPAPAASDERPGWPEGARALVPGIVLGDDHALPTDLRQDMRTVSLGHLTAVSGQHVALVLGTVLAGLGVLPRRARAVVGAAVLVALVVLVRPGGSVLRAATMGGVMLAGVASGRRSASVPALSLGALVLLLADPWQARDYGFALSVTATGGILLGARPLETALSRRMPRWLAGALALPVVAQAACAPVLVLLQPSVGPWSVPANVLAAPAVPPATLAGLAAALAAPLWPAAAQVLAWPATAACAWIVQVARTLADLPGADLPWPGGVPGALALAALQTVGVALAARGPRQRLWAGLVAAVHWTARWASAARGRLAPWQTPDPRAAPDQPAVPLEDPPGTRSTSPPWCSSVRARRSSRTGPSPAS